MPQKPQTPISWGAGEEYDAEFAALDWNAMLTPEQKVQMALLQLEVRQQALEARLNAIKRMKEILTPKG
jgi:hypothetical protein